jgi:transposase
MHQGKYVFAQVMEQVVRYKFNKCVERYSGGYWVKSFSCWEQFLSMAFGQLAMRNSLRDVVVCLNSHVSKLYHLGFHSAVYLPTLAKANEKRDWRIYRDYAQILIAEARGLYANDQTFNLELDGSVYLIDSTTIELCLKLFPWAKLKKVRAAVKLNLGLELKGSIPAFFQISSGKTHDIYFLDFVELECGAYYVMDKGYVDFERLYKIHTAGAFFVTRAKNNFSFKRIYSKPVDRDSGIICDQVVKLKTYYAAKSYPDKLRRIKYYDKATERSYVFLTNNFDLPAQTIALLYKYRWQIELFFKWIKQHLSIESFWGRSENAVKTQICVALCAYLLVSILKKKFNIHRNSYEILQILSVSLFDKTPVFKLVSEHSLPIMKLQNQIQPYLW